MHSKLSQILILLKYALGMLIFLSTTQIEGQDVRLTNPSFEDEPRRGTYDPRTEIRSPQIEGWFDCGAALFPQATPPDIHQGSSFFWENTLNTSHGKTYLTLVVREDDSYETISQRLLGTIKKGSCYTFSIHLAKSKTYMSHTVSNQTHKQNFIKPAVLRVLGGNGLCDNGELLAESKPVENTDWVKYDFFIEPNGDYTHLTFMAFFETPVFFGYNGNICLDNASHFNLVECGEEAIVMAEVKKEKKVIQKAVPSLRKKQPKQEVWKQETKEKIIDTIVYKKPKKLLAELETKKLKVGQKIKIDYLYFEADTSSINVESFEVLNEIYEFLDENEKIKIEIGGHTNGAPPSHKYCDKLSTERAKAVANYLINKGITEERISYKGYGKRKPLFSNGTAEGRRKNQRVQIKIISLG